MSYIDSVILDLTERFCQQFQLLTGRTNVWLAVQLTNLSILVYIVWAILYSWTAGLVLRLVVGLFCGGLLYVLSQTVLKVPIEAYENAVYRRVAKGFRNPRRIRDIVLRTSFLTLCIVLSYPIVFVYTTLGLRIAALTYSLIVLTTVILYLLACDPLPPCTGKVTDWLRGLLPARVEASRAVD